MNKDDATWLRIAYIVFAGISAFTFWKASETLGIQTGWVDRYSEIFPIAASLGSLGLGLLLTLWVSRDRERHDYFLASITELRKVTWPSMPDTRRMTIVVCVVVGFFAVVLALFDLLWTKVLGMILA